MIANKVKLVVWDLDDTFWRGTLSEGGISEIARNADIVRTLSARGIVNSISSKNDYAQAKVKLGELGIWDYFVFPSIGFNPKGKAVAELIEAAALRAQNVLFLDDNPLNLEEVKFFNPGIMTGHPDEIIGGLLDHPHLAGKPDPELTRLKQYRLLQSKFEERAASDLSNEEFLRASDIRIAIDYDVAANFDRVVDLINRSNQLNYTKRRLETPKALAEFRDKLSGFGFHAGCVRAVDSYGDYGLIGFFLMQRRAKGKRLIHFVFSCRTMNMGIEQYVHEMLGCPQIDIAGPVSYGLRSHDEIDWIRETAQGGNAPAGGSDKRLLLIGGCDLLQLANYCSANRIEFVNSVQDDIMVRFDDPGFITGDRAAIRDCASIRKIPCWTYEDAVRFDAALAEAELILVSMATSMAGVFLEADETVLLRQSRGRLKKLRARDPQWFDAHFEELTLRAPERLKLVVQCFDAIGRKSRQDSRIIVLGGRSGDDEEGGDTERKALFNRTCREYCERHPARFRFVDLDAVVPAENHVDSRHFSREGYFALAKHILAMAAAEPALAS